MVEYIELIKLLDIYGIDGKKLISNNNNVLNYGDYKEIEKIISYLLDKGFKPKTIENCLRLLTNYMLQKIVV